MVSRTLYSVHWTNIHKSEWKRPECALNAFGPVDYPLSSGERRLHRRSGPIFLLSSGEGRLVGVAARMLLLSSDGPPLRRSSHSNIEFCTDEPDQQKTQSVRIVFFEHYIRLAIGFLPFRTPLPLQRTVFHLSARKARLPRRKG